MKKSLMLISFAFIFLLSVSVVSANFFDWITGDVGSRIQSADVPKSVGDRETTNTFSRVETSTSNARTSSTGTSSASSARKSQAPECPRGWLTLLARDGGNCCRKAENTGRTGLFVR